MNNILKLLWFVFGTAVLLSIAAGYGLFNRDEPRHLAGDYYFEFSGGVRNSIIERRDSTIDEVIPLKVEEFLVHGNGIFVTRRPPKNEGPHDPAWNAPLAVTCEYYRIDVAARQVHGPFALAEVKTRPEWTFLRQREAGDGFGSAMCKLDAVKDQPG